MTAAGSRTVRKASPLQARGGERFPPALAWVTARASIVTVRRRRGKSDVALVSRPNAEGRAVL